MLEIIGRGTAIYFFILIILRLAGRRSLAQTTTFDLVLLLLISETTQQAMTGDDDSLGTAFLLITTLVALEVILTRARYYFPKLGELLDGTPVTLIENGRKIKEHIERFHLEDVDFVSAAREAHGLRSIDEIDFAYIENTGEISIVPKRKPNREVFVPGQELNPHQAAQAR
jgi:uncharacterized membrane protein YcaP (DUF421 family)